MKSINRRDVLLGAAGAFSLVHAAGAATLTQSIGVQLYTVAHEMERDFEGTLRKIAALGFQEVEFAGFFKRTPAQVVSALQAAGLRCSSTHFSFDQLRDRLAESIDFAAGAGVKYIVCAEASTADSDRYRKFEKALGEDAGYAAYLSSLTLDDWRWNADFFNRIGAPIKAAGMKLAFHNHTAEFRTHGNTLAYDELLRRTDPALVAMELDCAWATVGGHDPARLIATYPERIELLHIKDVKAAVAPQDVAKTQLSEVGAGIIDWRKVSAAAREAGVKHYFVEQDNNFKHSPLDSLAASLDFVRSLRP